MTVRGSDSDSGRRVLLVLDDAHTRAMIRTSLERASYDVEVLTDGEEALAACRRWRPDALIVGARLPKMDGLVFLYRLKGDGLIRCIPTLLVADEADRKREHLALSRGAKGVLYKPLAVRRLLEEVARASQGDRRALDLQHARQVEKLSAQDDRDAALEQRSAEDTPAGGPIRVPHKLVERVERPRSEARPRDERLALLETLREEVRRLKALPYHQRLGLPPNADPEAVATAFRQNAMKYHPDRYKHHGNDVRRLAQGVFVLLSDAKKALMPTPASPEPRHAEEASDSGRDLPPLRREPLRRNQDWTPASIDLSDLEPPPERAPRPPPSSDADPHVEHSVADPVPVAAPESAASPTHETAGLALSEPTARRRATALDALAEGRYRDAKNQIAKLLSDVKELLEDKELLVAEKLARGHLCWQEGYLDDAVEEFEAAFGLEPECPEALEAIAAIQEERDPKGGLLNRLLGKR